MRLERLKFLGVPCHSIELDDLKVFMADDGSAKRINFATSHAHALRKESSGRPFAWFNVPFRKTIEPLLKKEIGNPDFALFLNKTTGKPFRMVFSEREYEDIRAFMDKYKDIVFLRDCLDLSLSLSMNRIDENTRTEIGELEYQAKYHPESSEYNHVIVSLTKRMQGLLDSIPFFKGVDYICVVPSSHAFVREIVSGLKEFDFSDISSSLSWNKKTELKNADSLEDKLDALLDSHLVIADDVDLEGKSILLVDDLYKSGLTMQYVAMMLKNAGCSRVFGLTLVKSLGNN